MAHPQIHEASSPPLTRRAKPHLTQLRDDLRKMKAHRLVERDANRYAYRLTGK